MQSASIGCPQSRAFFLASTRRQFRNVFLVFIALLIGVASHAQVSVTTNHYDNARTGQNIQETILTPQNVSGNAFGVNFTQAVDGNIYGQPLYVPNLMIPGQGTHNVVFVVTEGDSVYAFDADSNTGANANPLWHASMIDSLHGATAGATTVPNADVNCGDLTPQIGITSTPVIDLTTGTMYVEAKSKENFGYVHRLHALDITTGAEKFGGPAVITGSVAGSGDGTGTVVFNPLTQHNRPGLLLVNGTIYIGLASHCDKGTYHGWLFAYDAATLARKAFYVTTPNGSEAGIWMSGNGPAADASGNVFLATGNGTFDNVTQLSDSVLKFSLSGSTLSVLDWFTPHNQADLSSNDNDVGSGGVVLLPDQPGAHPHLLVAGPGKDSSGPIYLIDRDNMTDGTGTHWCGFGCTFDGQIVEEIQGTIHGKMWSSPTYWNNNVYFWATNDKMRAYSLSNGLLVTAPFATSPDTYGFPGSNLTVSSNGASNGMVWSVEPPNTLLPSTQAATLKAHDANNLSVLYSSDQNLGICPADLSAAIKFSVPTVANGQVFLGTDGELKVYGFSSQGSPACGFLGFTGQFSCDTSGSSGPCDTGSISVTVGPTTETLRYDGLGFFTGTGYNNGNPGIPQTVAQTIVNLFNNDSNSAVRASTVQDTYASGFDVQFNSKASGGNVNYPATITVTSDYGNFQQFGVPQFPFQWTWSPLIVTGGVDPTTMTQVTPLSGKLQGGRGAATGANASLSPASLTFGSELVGTTSGSQGVTLTISATATARLSITGIAASGDFSQTNNCPSTLAVGTSCTMNVTFIPTATGTRSGTLSVSDNAGGSPQTASLSGTGIAPVASLSPTSLSFANQFVNTTSSAQAVTLTNTGTAALSISSITTSGNFAQSNNCPSSLAVNGSCTINVTFTPTATGTRTGTLSVSDNASGSPQTTSLSGTGVAPGATLSPASLTFGNQIVGTSSAAQPVTLKNVGSGSLSINSIGASGDFAQTNNCPSSLAVNGICTINVTFTPTASGTRTGTLSVSDNASGSPQTVSLSSTGVPPPPVASLSPTSLSFANQIVGTTSSAKTATLTNTGGSSLAISSITVSGDFAQSNNCPSSLGVNASCTINMTFTPTATGARSGTVSVNDNAGGSPQTVSLSGTGVSQATATITFNGTEKNVPATSGTGTVTIGGPGDQLGGNDGNGNNFWDSGTVFIGVPSGTSGYTVPYGGGSPCCTSFIAQYLVNGINQGDSYVSASCQGGTCGNTIVLTAKTTGANTNYSLSAGSPYDNTSTCYDANANPITPCFTQPSFTTMTSGATLTGGADAVYDTGSIAITVNGHRDSCPNYSQTSTTSSIASNCASSINGDSGAPVTAVANGANLTLTAKQPGTVGNGYSLSVSISSSNGFSPPSFSASYPSSLSGGH